MGLDATVYCDCFEKNRLLTPPPTGCRLLVEVDGSLWCDSNSEDVIRAFDEWRRDACEHKDGVLVHHRIGNIATVGALRSRLEQEPHRFAMLLSRVLQSGSHCGDQIDALDVPLLQPEILALAEIRCEEPDMEEIVRQFEAQMVDLVANALRVNKPIAF